MQHLARIFRKNKSGSNNLREMVTFEDGVGKKTIVLNKTHKFGKIRRLK